MAIPFSSKQMSCELHLTRSITEFIFLVAKLHFSFDLFNQPTFALCEAKSRAIAGGTYLLYDSERKKLQG